MATALVSGPHTKICMGIMPTAAKRAFLRISVSFVAYIVVIIAIHGVAMIIQVYEGYAAL